MYRIVEDNGELYNWIKDSDDNYETLPNDLTIGLFNGKVLLAGVVYSVTCKNICYITIKTASPKWCTKANLSRLFELPFEVFKVKVVKCATSHKNKRINRLLTKRKLREEGYLRYSRPDGSHERVFSLTLKELKNKEWYRKWEK